MVTSGNVFTVCSGERAERTVGPASTEERWMCAVRGQHCSQRSGWQVYCSDCPTHIISLFFSSYCLAGLVVKASASWAEDPGFESCLRRDFSGSSHTSDLKIGTTVTTLPGAWRYRVSTGTGQPSVSILWLGEVESLICNFCLSVVARKIVSADPSMRYTSMCRSVHEIH